jgi:hypothetical protein
MYATQQHYFGYFIINLCLFGCIAYVDSSQLYILGNIEQENKFMFRLGIELNFLGFSS